MELIEWILQEENMDKAIKSVKRNRGAYSSRIARVSRWDCTQFRSELHICSSN